MEVMPEAMEGNEVYKKSVKRKERQKVKMNLEEHTSKG